MEQSPELLVGLTDFTRWGAELRASLARTLNGVWLQGALPVPLGPVSAGNGGTQQLSSSAGRCVGWSVRNQDGVNARVINLRERNGEGPILATITLPGGTPGAASTQFFTPGFAFTSGLYAEITDGNGVGVTVAPDGISGAVYLGATE